jgi:hypothetical protein
MQIEERLVRRDQEDIIEIGRVAEKFYNGQAGVLFRSIINGIIQDEISQEHDVSTSADRRLGRAEGANKVRNYIEMAIQDMKRLTEPKEYGKEEE